MKKIFFLNALLLLLVSPLFFTSCSDSDSSASSGPITLEFDNIVGTANLQLNTTDMPYFNSHDEAYKVTWLTYYVSNIKLKKSDGNIYEDPVNSDGSAGYYLVDESDGESQEVTLENVPEGDYVEVTFTIGVDASHMDQSAQTGAFDPANGLFWNWDSGYIFLALEGVSSASTETDNVFQYRLGGYKDDEVSGQVNNIRTITLSFNGDSAPVRPQHEPEVHLLFDVNKFLNGSGEEVTFAANASRHSPKDCEDLADNISSAFVVDHVHAN